ncbi:outer membrane lipoprotein carrier protein LolA [Shewanella salipaludis]|uniref:Outer membrane lipoprotein carrier protein LolA n=1 Tax=Shewanella salipaludis TaxID=2723052 RepID=A0A972JKK9_9GAMM|nr:outer membrane lipoprotein carrier protein LolA [Shewanella salipaludis]NMH66305.1 outer membrane lipoprotein carrier protein LolA [Shewanella salipaludis]
MLQWFKPLSLCRLAVTAIYLAPACMAVCLAPVALVHAAPLATAEAPASIPDAGPDYRVLFARPASDTDLLGLSQRLQLPDTVRGEFSQARHLKVLKRPLLSRGEFIFDRAQGLVWQQTHPFDTLLILKDKQLIQRDSQGKLQVSDATQAQGAGAISQLLPQLMLAILSGDIQALSGHFSLYLQHPEAATAAETEAEPIPGWRLGLIPRDPLVAKAIAAMVLEGDKQLDALTLLSDNGDLSRIEFSAQRAGPLAEDETALYRLAEPTQ